MLDHMADEEYKQIREKALSGEYENAVIRMKRKQAEWRAGKDE